MPDYSELIFRVKKTNSEAAIQDIGHALDKTSASASQLQGMLAKIAGFVGVAQLAKTLINASDSVRKVDQGFKSVFTSTEKATAELKRLQSTFQMTDLKARQSLAHVGQLIRHLVPRNALQDVSGQITELAEDLSVRFDIASEHVRKSIAQALTGRTKGLLQFGVQINVNDDDFKEAVAAQMRAANLTEQQAKSLTIMQEIMKQTASAQGEYARSAGSASAQLGNVKDSVTELIAVIADQLNPVMASMLSTLNSGIGGVTKMAQNGLVTAGAFTTILGGAATSAVKMNESFSKTVALMKGMKDLSNIDFFKSLQSKDVLDIKKTLGNMKLEAWGFGQVLQESFKKGEQSFGTWISTAQETHQIEDQMKGVGRAFDALATKQDTFFKSGLGTLKAWGEDVTGLATKYKSVSTEAEHMLESWVKIQQLQALYDQGLSNPEEIAKAVNEYQESLGALTKLRASFSEDFIGKVLKYDMQAGYELEAGLNSLNQAFAQTGELSHRYLALSNADFREQGAMVPIFDDLQQRMRNLSVNIIGCDRAMSDWLKMNPNDFFVAMTDSSLSLSESLQALEKRSDLAVHAFSQLLDPNVKQVDKLKHSFEALSKQTETLRKTGGMSSIGGITIDGPNGVKNVTQSLSELTMKIIQSKEAQKAASMAQAKAAKTAYLWLNRGAKESLLLNGEISRSQLLISSLEGAASVIENVNGAIGNTADKAEMLGAVGDKLHESLIASISSLPNVLDIVNGKLSAVTKTMNTFIGSIFSGGGRGSILFQDLTTVMTKFNGNVKAVTESIVKAASKMTQAVNGMIKGAGTALGNMLTSGFAKQNAGVQAATGSIFRKLDNLNNNEIQRFLEVA